MRTTINIDDNVAEIAQQLETRENRNFSNLCEVALQEYCAARGLVPAGADDSEFFSKLTLAMKDDAALRAKVENLLRKATRENRPSKS